MAQTTTDSDIQIRKTNPPRSNHNWKAYLYLFPTFVVLFIFVYFPIYDSFRLSLNRVAPFGSDTIFVGFGNYTRLFESPDFWNTVRVSLWFMVGTVPVGIAGRDDRVVTLVSAASVSTGSIALSSFVPVVISSAIGGVLFRLLYNPVVGFFNHWLSLVGIDGPNWLNSKSWALVAVCITVVWRQLGFNVIISLAGIQNIDEQLYEAAKVDGASALKRIRHVTLPMLSPTLFFLFIVNVITSLQAFGEINILTDGGPGEATTNLVYSVFVDAFVGTSFRGLASAQAFMLAVIIIFISYAQFRGLGKKVHYQ